MNYSPLPRALADADHPHSPNHRGQHARVGRRGLAVAGLLAFALLATGACGKKDGGAPQADATVGTTLDETPTASAQATAGSSAAPKPSATSGGGGQQPVSYPSTAKEYGLATLAAWATGSRSRLDLYATQPAVAQFEGHGKPNSQWTTLSCEAAGSGFTACNYRNAHGDDARLTMMKSQLGHPTATTDVFVNRTDYATDAAGYVSYFMAAWGDDNRQRMARFSSTSIAEKFYGKTPPTGSQTNATQSGGTWTVEVTGLPVGSGTWTFTVSNSKLGGGNAITGVKTS
ncbi:hypothetical protein F4553_000962 [Allocatelliglobosispora scoriae]|uniref:Uncharacterized protein n=1 Tax=Allocatelliglobosispora scoriae TaxID=643052 RepID=A0A841BKQ8_9ACTN|nr:hypothetical protein [Allocatelliglobosispora scoriae]MBB5867583.1 hypothetical protein [Allocatelliglobosispora scoriae]